MQDCVFLWLVENTHMHRLTAKTLKHIIRDFSSNLSPFLYCFFFSINGSLIILSSFDFRLPFIIINVGYANLKCNLRAITAGLGVHLCVSPAY